jgi:putative ABC transport system substrate-binding protein
MHLGVAVRRRQFLGLAGAVAAWPIAVRAQSVSTVRRICFLLPGIARAELYRALLDAFREGLRENGWLEGQNVTIEYRFAEGNVKRLPALATELVQLQPEIIVVEGTLSIQAAKNATSSIPIVMATSIDPVSMHFVAGLARPGGNITGISLTSEELSGKRLQLLTEIIPRLTRVAVMTNPVSPAATLSLAQTQAAGQSLGVQILPTEVRTPADFANAFSSLTAAHTDALIVTPDPMLYNEHPQIVAFAAASKMPALYPEREVARSGGLMAYGPSIPASFRRAAAYVDKILRGTKPADLPVEQPTKFDLTINLKTAKALGLTIPPALLALADEVVE